MNCYIPSNWTKTIASIVRKFSSERLFYTTGVVISLNELNAVEGLKNAREERVLFTLLCLAKLGNQQNGENSNWVNMKHSEIFRLARVPVTVTKQCLIIHSLAEKGFIKLSKRVDSLSINVLCVEENPVQELFVSDFRELGYEYLKYRGNPFTKCSKCGVLIKKANNRTRYCKKCSAIINRTKVLENYYKNTTK